MQEQSGGAESQGKYGKYYLGKNKDRQPVRKMAVALQKYNKRMESYTTRRHALLASNSKHHGDNKREVNIIPIDNDTRSQPLPYKNYMQFITVNQIRPKWHTEH